MKLAIAILIASVAATETTQTINLGAAAKRARREEERRKKEQYNGPTGCKEGIKIQVYSDDNCTQYDASKLSETQKSMMTPTAADLEKTGSCQKHGEE